MIPHRGAWKKSLYREECAPCKGKFLKGPQSRTEGDLGLKPLWSLSHHLLPKLQGAGGGPSGVALNRLAKELRDLQKKPEEGIKVGFNAHEIGCH